MKDTIRIEVTGPEHSGKGHVIALIAHMLREHGVDVIVQGEHTHNAAKMLKDEIELLNKIDEKHVKVLITEMQTGV